VLEGENNKKTEFLILTMQKKSLRLGLFLFLIIVSITFIDAAVLFESDWSTATGTSNAAILDTDKAVPWEDIRGPTAASEVISASGLDFPTTNVLKITAIWNGVGGSFAGPDIDSSLTGAIPDVGDSTYYRVYLRVLIPDSYTADDQSHPYQDGPGGGSQTNWLFKVLPKTDGTWIPQFGWPETAWPNDNWDGPNLNKNQTYRIEHRVHRIGNMTANLHVRVYDSSDVLLYTDSDFDNQQSTATLASTPTFTFRNLNHFKGIRVGDNGLFGGVEADYTPSFIMYHWGGLCMRDDTWCGAYNSTINDTTPPTRSSGLPSTNLSAGTNQTTISLTTNEAATCKYGTTANTAYSSIANTFSTTGGTSHSRLITGLSDGNNFNYYVRCNDSSNNFNTNDFTISFGVDIENQSITTFTYNWSHWHTNETTNFSIYNKTELQSISDVKFANQHGTINFLEKLNLSKLIYDLRNRIRVFSHKNLGEL